MARPTSGRASWRAGLLAVALLGPGLAPLQAAETAAPAAVASASLVLERGTASYLAKALHGRKTASGERYDMNELTAAHKTLPFGTRVIVRSLQTGREVAVRITDRGPHLKNRIIDLSYAAAAALGIKSAGLSQVEIIKQPSHPPQTRQQQSLP